jgi:hypothetical protein
MNYEDFVMRTARQQHTARTMDEAFRTPEYAASVHRFEQPHKRDLQYIATFVLVTTLIVVISYALNSMFDLFLESIR